MPKVLGRIREAEQSRRFSSGVVRSSVDFGLPKFRPLVVIGHPLSGKSSLAGKLRAQGFHVTDVDFAPGEIAPDTVQGREAILKLRRVAAVKKDLDVVFMHQPPDGYVGQVFRMPPLTEGQVRSRAKGRPESPIDPDQAVLWAESFDSKYLQIPVISMEMIRAAKSLPRMGARPTVQLVKITRRKHVPPSNKE